MSRAGPPVRGSPHGEVLRSVERFMHASPQGLHQADLGLLPLRAGSRVVQTGAREALADPPGCCRRAELGDAQWDEAFRKLRQGRGVQMGGVGGRPWVRGACPLQGGLDHRPFMQGESPVRNFLFSAGRTEKPQPPQTVLGPLRGLLGQASLGKADSQSGAGVFWLEERTPGRGPCHRIPQGEPGGCA